MHTHSRVGNAHVGKSALLKLTRSRLLMNEYFLYLSSQPTERGSEGEKDGGRVKEEERGGNKEVPSLVD